MRGWLTGLAPLAVLGLVACRTADVLEIRDEPIPGTSVEQVRDAIHGAGTRLGWAIEDRGPGQATGTLEKRGHVAVVDIRYSVDTLSITYADSTNLKYDGTKIHKRYNAWVLNLERQIRQRLGG